MPLACHLHPPSDFHLQIEWKLNLAVSVWLSALGRCSVVSCLPGFVFAFYISLPPCDSPFSPPENKCSLPLGLLFSDAQPSESWGWWWVMSSLCSFHSQYQCHWVGFYFNNCKVGSRNPHAMRPLCLKRFPSDRWNRAAFLGGAHELSCMPS